MNTREVLLDIVTHTGGLGFIETVKVTTEDDTTKIDAMDDEKSVIIKGQLVEQEPKFVGEFGIGKLSQLKGIAELPAYKTDDATISVTTRERNGEEMVESIIFKAEGRKSTHRLMSADLVPPAAKFLGTEWDIVFTPTKSVIAEFGQNAAVYSSEEYFSPRYEDGVLYFDIGDPEGSQDATTFVVSDNVEGDKLKKGLYWPIQKILSILKLDKDGNAVISIAETGALQIEINSNAAQWKFILPARIK